ncbi:hydrogenase expression/formation protein HupK [Mameliella sp. AT18]|uniref:hypothetical protein n=1 Tax=Mameliella sp. AT18 TaxID=3028385 RepID=UPI0008410F23|nr:hypothetical protein [Mameliella sp. AT18]MDD9730508.1 hydrogenase expression/formation protein HupK [Mameliella sp. AT18]ODM48093.1 hypothetical protein A9320_20415 [Ruegeria sp. PBVC088]
MLAGAAYPALRAVTVPGLPVARLVIGKPAAEAAELLPRLFNLCRVAQGVAARAAFGLPLPTGWQDDLRAEILREHVAKLCLRWPALVSLPPLALPRDWQAGNAETRRVIFGPAGQMPETPEQFRAFLEAEQGCARLLRAISRLFAPFEACRTALPAPGVGGFFGPRVTENSTATRQAAHPVLQDIETRWGRGPLWSATALACDLQAVLDGRLPAAVISRGCAVVPAARGLYGITASVEHGRVTAFARQTPTDHLLAPGGALEQSLASLRPARAQALGPLVLSLLDPCSPVRLEPFAPMEADHA